VNERVRKAIDGELDARELRELRADQVLAAELAAHEEVARALSTLEAPEPPRDLVDRAVLRAVQQRAAHEASTPEWKRWIARLFEPRTVRVRIAPAVALVAAIVAAWIVWPNRVVVETEHRVEITDAAVRLVLPANEARTVAVAGDWNDWRTDETYLEDPDGDGVFVGTLRLPPGSYAYMFVVDGEEWVTDPYAVNHRDDDFGNRNAVLRID
jgi:hypothetical protein